MKFADDKKKTNDEKTMKKKMMVIINVQLRREDAIRLVLYKIQFGGGNGPKKKKRNVNNFIELTPISFILGIKFGPKFLAGVQRKYQKKGDN